MTCLFPHRPSHAGRDGLGQSLMDLDLNLRTYNALRRNGFHCLADLVEYDEERLLAIRGFGAGAVAEIRTALGLMSLDLPFTLADVKGQPPQTIEVSIAQEPVPTRLEQNEEKRWCGHVADRVASREGITADRLLQELQALTLEHFSSLQHRLEEIHQFRAILRTITEVGARDSSAGRVDPAVVHAVHWQLLRRYGLLITGGAAATGWLSRLLGLRDLHRAAHTLLLHSSGITLQAIAQAANPPVTPEAVKKQIKRVEMIFGCRTSDLGQQIQQHDQQRRADLLRNWISTHGRLPFHTDEPCEGLHLDQASRAHLHLREVSQLNLSRRLALYADLNMPVPAAEWDLHCRVIGNSEERPGTGYWNTLEPLSQFLIRYARVLRRPGVMPFQEQLPPAVQGAVQRHAGQSAIAQAVGLRYEGQLVGDTGRTYWTEDRLNQLLNDAASHSALPAGAMPGKRQIREYMQSAVHSPFWGKKTESALAALTIWSKLTWDEVAQRFGRRVV